MPLTARQPLTSSYIVEVSGWDSSHTFFVEKSDLSWNETTGKSLSLTRELRDHAIIFVRLLQANASERTSPVAYQAELQGTTADGHHMFRVTRIVPRDNASEGSRQ